MRVSKTPVSRKKIVRANIVLCGSSFKVSKFEPVGEIFPDNVILR